MRYFDIRIITFLDHLAGSKWCAGKPQGVGPKTIATCRKRGWVEHNGISHRITALGIIIRQLQEERRSGHVGKELRDDRLQLLRELIGGEALHMLQNGTALIHRWRRTTPHNWWVENSKGKMLWHSLDRERPDFRMLELVRASEERIRTGMGRMIGADEGASEEEVYCLKRTYRTRTKKGKRRAA